MKGNATTRKPLHPKLVLLIAIVLPGMGQVANRMPTRGLMFLFYVILLAVVTYNLTTPDHSFSAATPAASSSTCSACWTRTGGPYTATRS